jgi:hypothetical protein
MVSRLIDHLPEPRCYREYVREVFGRSENRRAVPIEDFAAPHLLTTSLPPRMGNVDIDRRSSGRNPERILFREAARREQPAVKEKPGFGKRVTFRNRVGCVWLFLLVTRLRSSLLPGCSVRGFYFFSNPRPASQPSTCPRTFFCSLWQSEPVIASPFAIVAP